MTKIQTHPLGQGQAGRAHRPRSHKWRLRIPPLLLRRHPRKALRLRAPWPPHSCLASPLPHWPDSPAPFPGSLGCKTLHVSASVADLWHFGTDPDPVIFLIHFQDASKKIIFYNFSWLLLFGTFWKHIYIIFRRQKFKKKSQNSGTNGSRSRRPKNIRIRRIRIRNSSFCIVRNFFLFLECLCWPLLNVPHYDFIVRYQDSNPERCRCKQARNQLSHPSLYWSRLLCKSVTAPRTLDFNDKILESLVVEKN